jgi:hypothetical protein
MVNMELTVYNRVYKMFSHRARNMLLFHRDIDRIQYTSNIVHAIQDRVQL